MSQETPFPMLEPVLKALSTEQLGQIESHFKRERLRRILQQFQEAAGAQQTVLIDFDPLVTDLRQHLQAEMSLASESALASILQQVEGYDAYNEEQVTLLLRVALTATFIHEAQQETDRRVSSVR